MFAGNAASAFRRSIKTRKRTKATSVVNLNQATTQLKSTEQLNVELYALYDKVPKWMRRFKCRLLDWVLVNFCNELTGK
jgi:hypothetical protein